MRRWVEEIALTCDADGVRWADMVPVDPSHQRVHGQFRWRDQLEGHQLQADSVYTAAGTLLPWYLYQATGDISVLEASGEAIERHLQTWPRRADWPLIDASRHGDHAAMPARPDTPPTPKPLVSQAILLTEFRTALQVAAARGREVPAWLAARAAELEAAMRERWGKDFADPASAQGTLAVGLSLGLGHDPAASAQALIERVEADGRHVATGIILTRDLLRVLGDIGRADLAYDMVTREGEPGWLWMLETGDGTLHENTVSRWPWAAHDQAALGVVAEWMIRDVLGLRPGPAGPAFGSWEVRPRLLAALQWAEGSVLTPRGPIHVRWERDADGLRTAVTGPARPHHPAS